MKKEISRKFCVAPMMGYTTPYARKLYRILSNNSFLFSEMIATKSLIYSKSRENIIDNDFNNPVALQVGGSEIDDLKKASKIAIDSTCLNRSFKTTFFVGGISKLLKYASADGLVVYEIIKGLSPPLCEKCV